MNFKTLFFSWDGRCARKPYWAGIVSVEIAAFILAAVLGLLGLGVVGTAVTTLVLVYPQICVLTKRFHDLGRSGWWQILPNAAGGLLSRGGSALMASEAETLGALIALLGLIVTFGFLIWLGCVKSQPRTNEFGPPPGQADVVEVF